MCCCQILTYQNEKNGHILSDVIVFNVAHKCKVFKILVKIKKMTGVTCCYEGNCEQIVY